MDKEKHEVHIEKETIEVQIKKLELQRLESQTDKDVMLIKAVDESDIATLTHLVKNVDELDLSALSIAKEISKEKNNAIVIKLLDPALRKIQERTALTSTVDGETEAWYFTGIDRQEATHLLMDPENDVGSFLIRQSENPATPFTLSVRFGEAINHYRIGFLQDDATYFVIPSKLHTFKNLQDLVKFYTYEGSLCCPLTKACYRDDRQNTTSTLHKEGLKMDTAQLRLIKKLGSGQFAERFEGLVQDIKVAVKNIKANSGN
ncbi:unnamed protein product [Meganyctiphanes norvegica]|uniref:SH2 domain-containing protein n=1 Tax=Meganyctiphanes norvegica TaxID=48144 RepID=A0AAV2PZH1_MEGNR